MRLRSVLFAPGHRPDVVLKTTRAAPDAVVIDWEDAVPSVEKAAARSAVSGVVDKLRATAPRMRVFVRVNPVVVPEHLTDVEALPRAVDAVVLPKVEDPDDVPTLALRSGLPVVAGVETARGVAAAAELIEHAHAVYFGAEDFTADMSGVRTAGGAEVLYARSRVVLAARLVGVPALDQVVPDYNDHDAFRADATVGRALGYTGKMCIHPHQVPLATKAFTPSEQELAQARRIIDAHASAGGGVVTVDGRMIDEPLVRRARDMIAAAG